MPTTGPNDTAAGVLPRRLFFATGGFLTNRRHRAILQAAGHSLHVGRPRTTDGVIVWGQTARAHRGAWLARKTGTPLIRAEDAFLRSVHPGRSGSPTLGLILDSTGMHYDPSAPSTLETLLATHPLDDPKLLARARDGIAYLRRAHLSKYNTHDPSLTPPDPGYVLVIDQTRGDASAPDPAAFQRMLTAALDDHPNRQILIKTHPETQAGHRPGHFAGALPDRVTRMDTPHSPWTLLEGAESVYAVSSHMGLEAILAGHTPHLFGQPAYAGWGLTHDHAGAPDRRKRKLSAEQLFAATYILWPLWYDPHRQEITSFERATEILLAQTEAFRQDRRGYVAAGMRLWKRGPLQKIFGREQPLLFAEGARAAKAAEMSDRPLIVWANQAHTLPDPASVTRVEDGFLRSRGLGAALTPPLSLVLDDLGIYYDPTGPSRLEKLIAGSRDLAPAELARATDLAAEITQHALTKYNLDAPQSIEIKGNAPRILIPGQVENDASILCGTTKITSNRALIEATRDANPNATLIYKPHPDVEAGLRPGALDPDTLAGLIDVIAADTDPAALLTKVDSVWTMTSLLGFEALLRGLPVTCAGMPFYAGWGLTTDLTAAPSRRAPGISLAGLIHATLIDYPRYFDPATGTACPPEIAVHRLATGTIPRSGPGLRLLAKAQGLFASRAALWR